MAYNRAPRRSLLGSNQTGPDISPNSYQVGYKDNCSCKGTNWAPFLSCSARKTTQTHTTPGPDAYYPQINQNIIGGSSLRYTAPRFTEPQFPFPAPNEYDPYHTTADLSDTPPPRLKGYLYHCHVPYTILGYMPSIPDLDHSGYKILEDRTMVKCCETDNDTTLGPAYYHVNFDTFGTCYRGSYWSKYSRRTPGWDANTPGVGTYDLQPQPTQLQEYLDKLHHERRKNACVLRYMDKVWTDALKNDYPAPNQYHIQNINKCYRAKPKLVPKRIHRPRKPVTEAQTPAPNQYNDPRTAFEYLTKPSCKKELNAFLANAPRFQQSKPEDRPAPNQYHITSFVEELAKRVSPYAVRTNTAFDTTVPKKLYHLAPDYPLVQKPKRCKCSGMPAAREPPPPKPKPTYPFSSTSERFAPVKENDDANCASYDIQKAFVYMTSGRSFRKVKQYNFLFREKRFSRLCGFGAQEDKGYIPWVKYNLILTDLGQRGTGKFSGAERFPTKKDSSPGPLQYGIVGQGLLKRTFNVSLGGARPLSSYQKYRMKLGKNAYRKLRKGKVSGKKKGVRREVQLLDIVFPLSEEVDEKKE